MTWLIGCPKSGGALINHRADWIQSSASPAQWWTGKDTVQVLTRMHSHCRRQQRCRGRQAKEWGDVCGQDRTPLPLTLSMSSSQWWADRQRRFWHLIITKGEESERDNNDRKWMWRRRFDRQYCDIHLYRKGKEIMLAYARVEDLTCVRTLTHNYTHTTHTNTHTHIHTHIQYI